MRIEHIAIWTNQLEALKEFYVQYFGGQANQKYHNPSKNFQSYFITFDSGARLELMYKPSIKPGNGPGEETIGITHLAFSTGSRTSVDHLTNLLRKNNFTIAGEPRLTGDGYYESVVLDPDGNRIEITA
jgi:lactoylglutathione lyase